MPDRKDTKTSIHGRRKFIGLENRLCSTDTVSVLRSFFFDLSTVQNTGQATGGMDSKTS